MKFSYYMLFLVLLCGLVTGLAQAESITLPGGAKYEGQVKGKKPHGKGVATWPNGNRYEGNFVNGQRTGKGVFIGSDGE